MTNPLYTVEPNRHSVVEAVLNGPQDFLRNIQQEIQNVFHRLGIKAGEGKTFRRVPRGAGSRPNMGTMKYWLDAITNEEKYKSQIPFLQKLARTIEKRLATGAVGK